MPFFWAMAPGREPSTAPCTLPLNKEPNRAGLSPIWTMATSRPGVKPNLGKAKRAMKSVAEPKRLIGDRSASKLLRTFDIGATHDPVAERGDSPGDHDQVGPADCTVHH